MLASCRAAGPHRHRDRGLPGLISADFFGRLRRRKPQEPDAAFRGRILAQLLLERGTRRGMIRALQLLTGYTPRIFEPWRPADTGAYNTSTLGYGVAGGYGSLALPFQCFVVAYRPPGQGIPNIAGYGVPAGGYGVGRSEYVTPAMLTGAVTDDDIYALIDAFKPAGTIAWTRIENYVPNASTYTDESGFDFYTDEAGNPYTTENT
ncbi:MAG: hypothetical protein U0835_00075 [Isosphaeraceae bacterium]